MPEEALETAGLEQPEQIAQTEKETETSQAVEERVSETPEATPTETPKQKFVPYEALHEERQKRKELSSKLEQTQQQSAADMARLQERVNIILQTINEASKPGPVEDPNVPEFMRQYMAANPGITLQEAENAFYKEEPNSYLKWRQDLILQRQSGLDQQAQQRTQEDKARQGFQNFLGAYKTNVQEFSTKQTDFKAAYDFLLGNRNRELEAMGFTDPRQRQQIMEQEEIAIVDQAFRSKINPAQRLYDLAKFRGYNPTAATPVTPESKPDLTKEKQLETATKSLSAVPGTSKARMTAEALLAMSEDDFAEATRGNKWAELFK